MSVPIVFGPSPLNEQLVISEKVPRHPSLLLSFSEMNFPLSYVLWGRMGSMGANRGAYILVTVLRHLHTHIVSKHRKSTGKQK